MVAANSRRNSRHYGVGRRIRSRCATDRRLVHPHQLVYLVEAVHPQMPPGNLPSAVELVGQHGRQDVVHQRRLAGAGSPVTEVSTPSGNDTSISCRLCSRAPTTVSCRLRSTGRRMAGTSMRSRPERYAPVSDSRFRSRSAYVPLCTMRPPCSPAIGPISTTQSACAMVSRSCSTTNLGLINSLNVGNANIYGHVATGPHGTVAVGTQGAVGDSSWQTGGNTGIKPGWIRTT